ncbi:MAG: MarR family transcriptional regulator [Anaerolineales bacterium]|jgi:DNA-binding MarR family transcriptional regulator|nr:MarR family transcriptional regulator [Anaerolineales bacterium]
MDNNLFPPFDKTTRDPLILTWHRMLRVTKKIDRYASEPIRAAGLSRPQTEMLAAIAVDEGLSQQTYADRLLVTKGNITQHLERFEERGLVTRRREGRTNTLYLTDAGRELLDRILPEHDVRLQEEFSVLDTEEFEQLRMIIRKLDRLLR